MLRAVVIHAVVFVDNGLFASDDEKPKASTRSCNNKSVLQTNEHIPRRSANQREYDYIVFIALETIDCMHRHIFFRR
jgi:hypothetical protein